VDRHFPDTCIQPSIADTEGRSIKVLAAKLAGFLKEQPGVKTQGAHRLDRIAGRGLDQLGLGAQPAQ
jgi:hypothetical protein